MTPALLAAAHTAALNHVMHAGSIREDDRTLAHVELRITAADFQALPPQPDAVARCGKGATWPALPPAAQPQTNVPAANLGG